MTDRRIIHLEPEPRPDDQPRVIHLEPEPHADEEPRIIQIHLDEADQS